MHEWQGYEGKTGYHEEYLLELLRRNSRGGVVLQSTCSNCQMGQPIFRCDDCPLGLLVCKACRLKLHSSLPLHVVAGEHHSLLVFVCLLTVQGLRMDGQALCEDDT